MSRYFNTKVYNLDYQKIDIDNLLADKMTLIVGDFWGIQSFIFDGLSTKNAAKVLRSKSAFIQIFTEVVAKYICYRFNIDEKYIISSNAGKFEILAPMVSLDLKDIQGKIDNYFIDNFYALSGLVLSKIEITKIHWQNNYKEVRESIAKNVEKNKFNKFNLANISSVLEYDTSINNQTLCKICNVRKIENENCHQCNIFVNLGKMLTQKEIQEIGSDELGIIFDDFITTIKLDKRIKSYIPKQEYGQPLTFENIAQNSCKESDTGIKALAILKADVDSMGNFIKNSDITNSFKNFDEFSKGLDGFFSIYVPQLLREKYRDIYTVFAGGDDLFLIGAWDEIMKFARDIQEQFKKYINHQKTKLSISFGISIAKPSTPLSYLANHTEELLETSKEIDDEKDALTIWSESVKWNSYMKVFSELEEVFNGYLKLETTTIYRLLEFCQMSKNINKDIKNSMWKSKLNYLFSRNMDINKDKELMEILDKTISNFPSETKIFLSEFIYKRRDV